MMRWSRRHGWRTAGLRHAIINKQRIEIEHFRNEAINQQPFWLHTAENDNQNWGERLMTLRLIGLRYADLCRSGEMPPSGII